MSQTKLYQGMPGANTLRVPNAEFNIGLQQEWVQEGIDKGAIFYRSSPMHGLSGSYTAEELLQLDGAGYR
jgi:hypothetical protein